MTSAPCNKLLLLLTNYSKLKSEINAMADIVIDVRAYSKMLLHTMKYPHHSVNGVFLAEKRRNKEHGISSVNIIDSIPLFHLCLSLTPMLEVAMMQVKFHYIFV